MTSKERIIAALEHKETDRVPIDIGGARCTGICVDAYCELLSELKIKEIPIVYEPIGMKARVTDEVGEKLHSDTVCLEDPAPGTGVINERFKDFVTSKSNHVRICETLAMEGDGAGGYYLLNKGVRYAYMPKGALYFDNIGGVNLSEDLKMTDIKEWEKQQIFYTDEQLKRLEKEAKFLRENTDKAIVGEFLKLRMGDVAGEYAGYSVTDWLCLLLTEPEYTNDVLYVTAKNSVENLKLYLQAVKDHIDVVVLSTSDFGTQRTEMFAPEIWKEQFMDKYKMVTDCLHERSKAKAFIHSCGSIYHIIPYIIEAGVDALNPVQTTADNMRPEKLKAEFGDKITFWGGGIDTQHILPFGSAEEVAAETKKNLDIFAPGGGFVFNTIHAIQADVPAKNLLAMVETVYHYKNK